MTVQMLLSLMLVLQLSLGMAATPVIGVATARGSFRLDSAQVQSNGTVAEGSTIETGWSASELQYTAGTTIHLGVNSQGRFYRDRMVLLAGAGEIRSNPGFGVEAKTLRIQPEAKDSHTVVQVKSASRVEVAALRGNLRVTTAAGVLVAALAEGRALSFELPQAGASGPVSMTGCLVAADGKLLLKDETTSVTVELRGELLDKQVGKRIHVSGAQVPNAKPAGTATQLIQVSEIKELAAHCSPVAGNTPRPQGPGAAPKAAAASGATRAIIAGVIVAAAAAGTAIAVTGSDPQSTTISR